MVNNEERTTKDENRVWVNVERTVSARSSKYLAQYESIKFSAGESRTVGPDEDSNTVRDALTKRCLNKIDEITEYWQQ